MSNALPSAAEIARVLAARIDRLALDLLPAARREGALLRVGGVDGEPGQSLALHVSGPRAGQWTDFATGEYGDALDLVRAVRRCDIKEALAWSRGWLGMAQPSDRALDSSLPPPPSRAPDVGDPDRWRRRAWKSWLSADPSLRATPAAAYLLARGIDLAELGRQPRALRFHPRLYCKEIDAPLPAMVAAVVGGGEFRAAHRTYLAKDSDGVWKKAPLASPRMCLGSIRGGIIPLQRGASGKPLAHAPEGETAVIAEGIETGLSIALACPEMRVVCGISLGNLLGIDMPPAVKTVIIAADNDGGAGPQKLLRIACKRFIAEGREVRIARSPVGNDFNDLLREGMPA